MTLRFVPRFTAQLKTVAAAQRCIGRDMSSGSVVRRAKNGIAILSVMITWALESAVTTADSMKSRGYGLRGRSAFSRFRFERRDAGLLLFFLLDAAYLITCAAHGGFAWRYYPTVRGSLSGPLTVGAYAAYLCAVPGTGDHQWEGGVEMACFTIRSLTFTYPNAVTPALTGIDLTLESGAFVTLAGPSGCGKSTLLRQLKTPLAPHGTRTGEILFEGESLARVDLRTQTARIGFVMQDPESQIVTDKVWHELAFGLESLGCDTPTIRRRVAEMASYFGIEPWFQRDVRELSGGQKQLFEPCRRYGDAAFRVDS